MANLTRTEAAARAALLDVTAYEVDLDLDAGDQTFTSTATIRFRCREPGATTWLDVRAQSVHEVVLNGTPLHPVALEGDRLTLPELAADNEVVVRATMRYSRDGQGLHRAVDPADGQHYVYGHLFLDAAPRVFACFDQPDLKAPYDMHVTAPEGWSVIGNGAARQEADGGWRLATTKPLATYFVTVCAGPYASVSDEHDGIPLGIHARASLREPLERQAAQMLEVTKASFDYYHSLFGLRYPFGEYHQVFVPEFNAGAMENPGCVTFRDQMVFRGAATREQVLRRSNTIAHEMAHMWFGDQVTMRWWDDLWLNESFAEYMAHRTLVAVTEFDDAWVDAAMVRKTWGYAAERMPSTHPVAGNEAADVEAALQNFDGISYAKGSAVLRQLIAHIGDEAFIAGLAAYLRDHRYGNADLGDFLGAMERASGQDLTGWSKAWLRTAGLDALSVQTGGGDGPITEAVLVRTPPREHPADRPHTIDVAGFTAGREVFRVDTTIDTERTELPGLVGHAARVIVPNASDLTWANVKLDAETVAALPGELALIDEPATRAVVWTALLDGVSLAEVDPRAMLRVFDAAWIHETNDSILSAVASLVGSRVIPAFLHEQEHEAAHALLDSAARTVLADVGPGTSRAFTAARIVAGHSGDQGLLEHWAVGEDLPQGLEGDSDFCWLAVRNLARRGLWDDAAIDRVLTLDQTIQGRLNALEARASRPDPDAKAWAWAELTAADRRRSNYEMNALALGFWQGQEPDLVRPYVERYFTDVPALHRAVGEDALARVASLSYPRTLVEQSVTEATDEALRRDDLTGAVRRAMVDQQALLLEAVRSREAFGPVVQSQT